jgi:hypothetical protein
MVVAPVYRDVMLETKKSIQLLQFYLNGGGAGVEEGEDSVEILEAGVRQHEVQSSVLQHQKQCDNP